MKTSFFKTALLALGTLLMLASCEFNQNKVLVGISASSTSFSNGKVDLVVSLSEASSKDVQAEISYTGNIPSFDYSAVATVKAGASSVKVPVSVDVDKLQPGTYEATFTIETVNGGQINASANSVTVSLTKDAPEVIPVVVTISQYSETFESGKASFILSLDKAAEADVTVNFTVETEVEGAVAIPAEALSFENPAVIAAGSTSKQVEVTLDMAAVQKGISNYAVIAIASVSENAKVAGSRTKTYIEANIPLTANLRSDWTVTFDGEVAVEDGIAHGITIFGPGEDEAYYIFVYQAGLVGKYFGEDVTNYIETMEGYVAEAMGTEDAYNMKSGGNQWLYNPFTVGSYEVWVLGCSASGHLTGDYGVGTFSVEPTAEVLEAYNKWLGEWNVTRQSLTDKWVISENVPGVSFYIQGIDGGNSTIADILVEADYDAANDAIVLYTQDCKEWTYNGKTYTIGLLGLFNGANLVSGDFELGTVTRTGENTATITSGGSQVTLSSGTYDVSGMTFFAYDSTGNGYVFNSQIFYQWPETMDKIVAIDDDPVYNAFLGSWNIKRNDSEWDTTTNKYIQKGEVSDTWTITPKVAGFTFYISGIEGYDDLEVVADYDKASGTFSISEQDVVIEGYTFCFVGLFYYPGSSDAPAGTYLWDGGARLFTAKQDGDVIALTAGNTGSYGSFLGMQTFQKADGSYYDLHEEGYDLPNTLTKAPSAGAPRKVAKTGGKNGAVSFNGNDSKMSRMSAPAKGSYRKGDRIERNLPLK